MFLAILLAFLFHAGLGYLFKRATIFEMVAAFEETLQVNQERERVTLDEITLDRLKREDDPLPEIREIQPEELPSEDLSAA